MSPSGQAGRLGLGGALKRRGGCSQHSSGELAGAPDLGVMGVLRVERGFRVEARRRYKVGSGKVLGYSGW